jgi:hypothetical protein
MAVRMLRAFLLEDDGEWKEVVGRNGDTSEKVRLFVLNVQHDEIGTILASERNHVT